MKHVFTLLFLLYGFSIFAQDGLEYQKPPKEILNLVDVSLAPNVRIDHKGENMVLLYRDQFKSIDELSETELRLAGLRINPITNIGSRTRYFNNVQVQKVGEQNPIQVSGLPISSRLSNFSWSPNESKMTFLNTEKTGVSLWVMDIATATAKKLTDATINANSRDAVNWLNDNELIVKMLAEDRKDLINTAEAVPAGPTVSVSDGTKAQNRTYQDLLKNPNDEFNFEQLSRSELVLINLSGIVNPFLPADMYRSVNVSPDKNYVMISTIKKPFSYLVPYSRFPYETNIYKSNGTLVAKVNDVPLDEVRPKGFMAERMGKRDMGWRADKPSTIYWTEALDKGDPENKVEYRDAVYQLSFPFTDTPELLFKTPQRFSGIQWGNSETAIVYDMWWDTRNAKTYLFNPSNPQKGLNLINDRNYQDVYNDPGNFQSSKNEYGEYVLEIDKGKVYLFGNGFSDKGQFPFIDELNLTSLKKNRLYQSPYTNKIEQLDSPIDMKKGLVLVRIESPTEYPNYFLRNIKKKDNLTQLTNFDNPFKGLQGVHKEVIKYKRDDGLDLDATLYLPLDYEKGKKYPMIMWAYPREYKDKSTASQNTSNPNEFIYPSYGSPIYWVTRGYVVLDDAAFPIVGEGKEEPNDTFRKQLVANAKAAIDAVDNLGYIDRNRVAVGGHSYGAFMTANLLSHSNLFAAGIARSGAYNRTLTPFGFQSEQRSYWDAPEIYYNMSPFMHADKMKTPLLLIHGEADNNSGTYPLQSERYFNALKGLGAPVRLVMLPKESHGYAAKESILHLLWEQNQWLEKYVKNKETSDDNGTN
ncbi:alpha/beta hydrolase family protein [Aegicerativicinus sediminis]|uniref:alpha/beta hydrolase family protein n=1 Tax=Aegicerativicinus sediminis TaxID=2893202 RepID=UPI001E292C4B|nr:prolyl oligopeptidase family serine peptidase [Aegicerativicinus sediminis]